MKRQIIEIDANKCDGCGECMPNCPEGALQLIDGKARLVSELMCDGLGACLKHCPRDAIKVLEREAEPYDERRVMENIVKAGPNTMAAHLHHLRDHRQYDYMRQALDFLAEKGLPSPLETPKSASHNASGGCPGARAMQFRPQAALPSRDASSPATSELTHWPIQLHLLNPLAPQYRKANVLLAADCVAFAVGDFHATHLKGRALAIACPKLDQRQDVYVAKLKSMMEEGAIDTLTVMIMEVPCCGGLLALALEARKQAARKVPIKTIRVSLRGEILREEWVQS